MIQRPIVRAAKLVLRFSIRPLMLRDSFLSLHKFPASLLQPSSDHGFDDVSAPGRS